jgi:hypothetical protein
LMRTTTVSRRISQPSFISCHTVVNLNNLIYVNILWPMPLFLIYYFTDRYWGEYILHTIILLGKCMVVWTWCDLEACLFWSCIDVIVVRVKVKEREEFSYSSKKYINKR